MEKPPSEDILLKIDEGIAAAEAITVQQALYEAVAKGRMSLEEAKDCLGAYERAFKTLPE